MNIENLMRIKEELTNLLEEEIDTVEVLKDSEEEILERLTERALDELAESYDYQVYYEDGEYLVINVKNRPNITNDKVIEFLNTPEGEEQYQFAIETFSNRLAEEIKDFVIAGRMGGYWGLSNLSNNIKISTDGYTRLAEIVNELKKQDPEAETYEIILDHIDELAEELELDSETLELKPEYLARMQELERLIDKQEEEMNKPEYWNI